MKNGKMSVVFAALVLLISGQGVFAQERASSAEIRETLTSLKGKLEVPPTHYTVDGERIPYQLRDASSDGCTLSFYKEFVDRNPSEGLILAKQRTRVNLSDFDPTSVRVTEADSSTPQRWKLEAFTTYNKKVIVGRDVYCKPDGTECAREVEVESDKVVFYLFDRELAKRAAAALKHAINLCGGKVDPF